MKRYVYDFFIPKILKNSVSIDGYTIQCRVTCGVLLGYLVLDGNLVFWEDYGT